MKFPVSMQCGACHEKEFRQWAGSDHAWAFRKLGDQWESEAFHNMKLSAHGSVLQFSTDGQGRTVHDGQANTSWRAEWATGRIPLVQYLVPAKDGGYHTLSAAWDVNRKEWFDIFGKEVRQPGDWGHWTGRGMNWNTQCAWCHMSLFHKNYDPVKDRLRLHLEGTRRHLHPVSRPPAGQAGGGNGMHDLHQEQADASADSRQLRFLPCPAR